MTKRPLIICLTPVKNEAWILDRFIQCTSLWADYIIVADQLSTDGSQEIVKKYAKTRLIVNDSNNYNETERQKLLLHEARQIPSEGRSRLIIALDADEFLSANFKESLEWAQILSLPQGTVIHFDSYNIHPDKKKCWLGTRSMPLGFMDDEITLHNGRLIHSHRVPTGNKNKNFHCKEIKILHYQFTDWQRMVSKHRWYQCFELVNRKNLSPLIIFRIYHHMYGISDQELLTLDKNWFDFYTQKGIYMYEIDKYKTYWWDAAVQEYFQQYGLSYFSALNIWQNSEIDPRSWLQKAIHFYLLRTQVLYKQKGILGKIVRLCDKFLNYLL